MMEPPAKRRRQNSSFFKGHTDLDDEPDELHSEPPHHDNDQGKTQVQAQVPQDDGYQFASKRLQANQRLEATFAHIIEKYSQNFDGIGDEIDMETGEIVVNNGHLRSMRHEGDLGGEWTDDIDDEDDDEGLLLEDLHDNLSDGDQEEARKEQTSIQNSDDHNSASKDNTTNESHNNEDKNDDHTTSEEVCLVSDSSAIISATSSRAKDMNMPINPQGYHPDQLAALFPHPYGSIYMGFIPAFGAMSPGTFPQQMNGMNPFNAVVPLSNSGMPQNEQGALPFMFNPWATAGLLPPQTWGQSGASMQPPQTWAQLNSTMQPQPTPLPLTEGSSTERSTAERYKFPVQKGRSSIWAPDSRQEKDDKPMPYPRRRPGRLLGARNGNHQANSPRIGRMDSDACATQSGDGDHENRRMSGRVRKQTEYMGKVSWSEADKITKFGPEANNNRVSEPDQQNQSGSDEDDELAIGNIETTPRSSQTSIRTGRRKNIANPVLGRVIPDSQDSATPPSSSAPRQSSQPKEQEVHANAVDPTPSSNEVNPSLTLSDDEAPLFLPRRVITAAPPASVERPDAHTPEVTVSKELNPQPESSTTLDGKKRRRRSHSRKSPVSTPIEAGEKTGQLRKILDARLAPLARGSKNLQETSSKSRKFMSRKSTRLKGTTASQETTTEKSTEKNAKNKSSTAPAVIFEPAVDSGFVVDLNILSPSIPEPKASPASTIPATEDDASTADAEEPPVLLTQSESPAPSPISKRGTSFHDNSPNTPKKPKHVQPQSPKPQTPRNTAIRTSRAPSSRRSLLSLVSTNNSDSESDDDIDELTRPQPSPFQRSAGTSTIKTWRSSALTREVLRTPIKKRHGDPISPGSVVKTPGGTVRTCGVDGYRCARDFCFNCL